ncbi:hypothetical protein C1H46_035420 [Malus baccata]|uniref:C3H1-type domain-containing protein n=1 Tax=Malus baccata TaxID=106549 RepID=A0A540KXS7_MALBA|nr:hypothetical protein C1H46_035420 [Malus baccata]
MLSAARLLLPLSLSVLVAIYNYYKSRQKSEFSEGVKVPLNQTSVPSPAPSDRYHEILHWIRTLDTLDPALLNRIRNRDPALLHEIQQFDPAVEIRNFDPGICKFGPACKFDHPLHISSSTTSGPDHQLPFSDSATTNGAGIAGSRNRTDVTGQPQPVQ